MAGHVPRDQPPGFAEVGGGLDRRTQVGPTSWWVNVQLVVASPARPVVKTLTFFHPVAPSPSKLLPEGLAS